MCRISIVNKARGSELIGHCTVQDFYEAVRTGYPDKAVMQAVQAIRDKSGDVRRLKEYKLPGFMVSGYFEGDVKEGNLVKHSGRMVLDIDNVVDNPAKLRDDLMKLKYIEFSALSVSGSGVFTVVKIGQPEYHRKHFKQLQADFESIGIALDRKCGNPNRIRFYSHDPDAKYNPNAATYYRIPKETPKPRHRQSYAKSTNEDVEWYISQLEAGRVDITYDYGQWVGIGFAFANEYGEGGRDLFHRVSQLSDKYNQGQADRKYTNCIKTNTGRVSIATFFHLCHENGIRKPKAQLVPKPKVVFDNSVKKPYPPDWDEVQPYPTDHPDYTLMLRHEAESIE